MTDRSLPADAKPSQYRKKAANRKRLSDGMGMIKANQVGLRVAIYIRVSSEEQKLGHSLDAQRNFCQEFADKRQWVTVNIYEDPGFSAKDDKRPAFQKMIADAKEKAFDVILVHKLDRFSRSIEQTLAYFKMLNEHGVVFTSGTENFDFSRPEGRLFFNMMAVFAQWYLENLSAEAIKAKEELFSKGLHNGPAPFGYQKNKKTGRCEIVPDEAKVVKAAFELSASGTYTHRMIAEMLNEQFTTRRGRHFSKDTVTNMLRNEFYYGMVSYRENIRPGIHDPIISKELYEKSQSITRERASTPKGHLIERHKERAPRSTTQRYYMLQRIIRCDACDRYLRIQSVDEHRYYKEVSLERGLTCTLAGKTVRMKAADQEMVAVLSQLKLPADWQEEISRIVKDENWIEQIKKKKIDIEDKIRRLDDVYISTGKYTRVQYLEERGKLSEQLESLVIPAESDVLEKGLVFESLGEYLKEATSDELAQICRMMVDSAYTDFVDNRIVRIKPTADFIELFRVASKITGWQEKGDGTFFVRNP